MTSQSAVDRTGAVHFIKWASGGALLLSALQLLIGGDPIIICLCLFCQAICLFPVYLYGLSRTVGVLYVFIWLTFGFSSLLGKTILFQPIDSNLFNPLLTFCVTLAGSIAFTVAATAAYFVKPLQKNATTPIIDHETLNIMAFVFVVIGIFTYFVYLFLPKGSPILNIAAIFAPYFSYGYVFSLCSNICRTRKNKVLSYSSLVLIFLFLYFGIAGNSKTSIIQIALGYLLCVFAFRVKIKWPVVVLGFLVLAFFSEYLFPAIHITRAYKDRLNPAQVAIATVQTMGNLLVGDPDTLAVKDSLIAQGAEGDPDRYQNVYFGTQQVWLDRFTNTGFIDAVARRVDFNGPFLGPQFILQQTLGFLPRPLDPDKSTSHAVAGGDQVTQAFGLTSRDQSNFSTVPLPINLFVADGFWFIFAIGVPLIFIFIVEINFFAFDMRDNVWSVVVIMTYGMLFCVSTYDVYIFAIVRQIPTNLLMFSLMIVAAKAIQSGFARAARASAPPTRLPRLSS